MLFPILKQPSLVAFIQQTYAFLLPFVLKFSHVINYV